METMEYPSREADAILESLLKLGTILPMQKLQAGITTHKLLKAQGKVCSLKEVLIHETGLSAAQVKRIHDLENIIPGIYAMGKDRRGKVGHCV